ncbi:hypothetical protein GCM10023172_00940 [Hymenobacter ginsengisoli]|uniref:Uncharacterized protein n=1 Tax=Hymenobacter ginsengisoli TaxID=1051626 RepID=A0ABP8PV39_9BACT|nr:MULTISPECIES: hypothetical protein [unclassified Hymenobacter]MBO2033493.1 hypothetical protein [Hymenobacter sp. BT559]
MQALVIRLIQEEFTPLLSLSTKASESDWSRAIALVDPTLLYCTAEEPTIRICPEFYQLLRECLQRELTKPAQQNSY